MYNFRVVFTFIFLQACSELFAQENLVRTRLFVKEVITEGNQHTKKKYILLETPFEEGKRLYADDLLPYMKIAKENLLRTSLFDSVSVNIQTWVNDTIQIKIKVKERWYIYPSPVFDIVDRNFNEWWETYNHNMSRTIFGLRAYHMNFLGMGDKLEANIIAGYNKKLELRYELPFYDRERNGLYGEVSYITNKEISYITKENKIQLIKGDNILRKKFRTTLALTKREKFTQTHFAGIQIFYNTIADTVALLNPDFFLETKKKKQFFPGLLYRYVYNNTNSKYYPTKGLYIKAEINPLGLRITDDYNALRIYAHGSFYYSIKPKINAYNTLKVQYTRSAQIPYFNYRALGYEEDFVRGYEYYVIDGENFVLNKNTIRYEIFNRKLNLGKFSFIPQMKKIPLKIYAKINADFGYVYASQFNTNNKLNNSLLYGYGVGLDFVSYYDISARVEYSINRQQEKGLYIHFKMVF
jgi:hypothetical protein